MHPKLTRRSFIKSTALAAGVAGTFVNSAGVFAANGSSSTSGMRFDFDKLSNTHDLRLPDWGPYNNFYNGITHVADLKQGTSFELSVFPGFFRRDVLVPNVKWVSGFHPWEAAPDLNYFSYRYELLWKDQLYCDVSFSTINAQTRLIRAEFVNRTAVPQNTVLHYAGYVCYPLVRPYTEEILQRTRVKLPDGGIWVNAIDYHDFSYATPRPTDTLVPGARMRGEVRDHGFVSGSGIGARFGKEAGDKVTYKLDLPHAYANASMVLRSRAQTSKPRKVALQLSGTIQRTAEIAADSQFTTTSIPLGSLAAGPFRIELITTPGGIGLDLDGFALVEESQVQSVQFEPVPIDFVPELSEAEQSVVLKYKDLSQHYGLAWAQNPSEIRQFHNSELDRYFRRHVQNHVAKVFTGDKKGHFTNVFIRPIGLEPGASKIVYGIATVGTKAEVESAVTGPLDLRKLEQTYLGARAKRHQFVPASKGETYQFSQEKMAATVLTNVVFPIYGKRSYFRHNSPGKWWDSLYTWDSGFIALGLTELDHQRAIDCINAYTTQPGDPQTAFLHVGTPLPVQIFAFWELWNRTQSRELLEYFYPCLRQYHMFLAGRYGSSTTRRLKSNLLVTWDYFYNTGWDDYPPQQYMHAQQLTRSIAPVITTAHLIRTAKMLRAAAASLGLDKDVATYNEDIALWSDAIQKNCWDSEAGYYSYVTHDEAGQPNGILRHTTGQNFNMGMDGVSPVIAGIGTPVQFKAQLKNLQSEKHLWTPIGLSTVDQSAAYYRRDGYWNGAVWMPHQWFIWKSLLDWGEGDFAFKIAKTALDLWKNEVDESYHCFEHFLIESRRGAGWHQFGALSSPVLSWFSAYYRPGRLTTGFDALIKRSVFSDSNQSLDAHVEFCGDRDSKVHVIATMNPTAKYRVRWNTQPADYKELLPGVLQISLPTSPKQGRLQVERS